MSKHIKRIPLYILAAFLLAWGISLLKCEILTHRYYDDFQYAHVNNSWIAEAEEFKVLNCNGDTAEVYYTSETLGCVLTFDRRDGAWVEVTWRAVWAKHGSASEFVWPYWWHIFVTGI